MVLVLAVATIVGLFSIGRADEVGVLVLAHGGRYENWDQSVLDAAEPLKDRFPVEVAFGMADVRSMQSGIDRLEEKGVGTIVVVPLFVSSHSPIIRRIEYLLGMRGEPGEFMGPCRPGEGHDDRGALGEGPPGMGGGIPVPGDAGAAKEQEPLRHRSKVVLTRPLDDHPLVAGILMDRLRGLSHDPERETVLIVAHGPNDEEDNRGWIETMNHIADRIRGMQGESGEPFKQIFCLTVRDDADRAVYDQAREHLRSLVAQAGRDGEVLVELLLLSQGGIEEGIYERLQGLTYRTSGKALLPHPNITRFIEESVDSAVAGRTNDGEGAERVADRVGIVNDPARRR